MGFSWAFKGLMQMIIKAKQMGFRFSIYSKAADIIIEIAPMTAVSIHI
jgi:hypothetical protein